MIRIKLMPLCPCCLNFTSHLILLSWYGPAACDVNVTIKGRRRTMDRENLQRLERYYHRWKLAAVHLISTPEQRQSPCGVTALEAKLTTNNNKQHEGQFGAIHFPPQQYLSFQTLLIVSLTIYQFVLWPSTQNRLSLLLFPASVTLSYLSSSVFSVCPFTLSQFSGIDSVAIHRIGCFPSTLPHD